MRVLKDQSGLTIVEVMVAAVILVISAVAILGLYSQNFGWIVNAGYVTEAVDAVKTELDTAIASGTTATADTITFSFNGTTPVYIDGTHMVRVTGSAIARTGTSSNGLKSVEMRTFIPTATP